MSWPATCSPLTSGSEPRIEQRGMFSQQWCLSLMLMHLINRVVVHRGRLVTKCLSFGVFFGFPFGFDL